MQFLHNKIIIGVLCIVVGLAVGFVLIPKVDSAQNATIEVVRATQDIPQGACIEEAMLEAVNVTASQVNLSESKIEDFVGTYAAAKIYAGDYLTSDKLNLSAIDPMTAATANNKMIVSVTVPSLAASASGIIQPGDVVMLMASGVNPSDYDESGSGQLGVGNTAYGGNNTLHFDTETGQFYYENTDTTVLDTSTLYSSTSSMNEMIIIDEIKYLEVCSISASDGTASVVNSEVHEGEANNLPYTISFFCTEKQALLLAQIEQEGEFHVAFVARGSEANAYIPASQRVLSGEADPTAPDEDFDSDYSYTTPTVQQPLEGSIGE